MSSEDASHELAQLRHVLYLEGVSAVVRQLRADDLTDALMLACCLGPEAEEIVRRLVAEGGNTTGLLHKERSPQMVQLLVELGAELEEQNELGHTPLISAAFNGFAQSVRTLLELGADVNATSPEGVTALHSSVYPPNLEIVRTLLAAGAFHSPRDGTGATPLHCAMDEASPAIVLELLEAGADPQVRDDEGATPLEYLLASYECRGSDIGPKGMLLLRFGADCATPFSDGRIASAVARSREDLRGVPSFSTLINELERRSSAGNSQ